MRTWAHWIAKTVMLTATFAAAGASLPGTAFAASAVAGGSTSGLGSVLGGHQAGTAISAPVDVCGNAVAVPGRGLGDCVGGASAQNTPAGWSGGSVGPVTSGNGSAGGGNQVSAPVSRPARVPAGVCGSAAAVLGDSLAGCEGTASVHQAPRSFSGQAGGTTGGKPMPANALAADSASGMGGVSFCCLAIGALMAGAVALKMAGRRIRGHRLQGYEA